VRVGIGQVVVFGALAALVFACSAGQAASYSAPRSLSPASGATVTTGQLRDFVFVVSSDLRCDDCSGVFDPWLGVVWSRQSAVDPGTGLLAPAGRVLCDQAGDRCAEPVDATRMIEIAPPRASEEFDGRHTGAVYWQPFRRECDLVGYSGCAVVGIVRRFDVVRGDAEGFVPCAKKGGARVRVKRIGCAAGRRLAGRFLRRLRSDRGAFPRKLGRYRCSGRRSAAESVCSRGARQVKIILR
jgi:hypothetical protein